jgi:hypothetical protein
VAGNRHEHRFGVAHADLGKVGQTGQVVAFVVVKIGEVAQAVVACGKHYGLLRVHILDAYPCAASPALIDHASGSSPAGAG